MIVVWKGLNEADIKALRKKVPELDAAARDTTESGEKRGTLKRLFGIGKKD